jgi:hypothetical protein
MIDAKANSDKITQAYLINILYKDIRMPYTVHLSNRNIVVQPGQIDQSTYISIIGRLVTNYGEYLGQDLINLLQNFASDVKPDLVKSVAGQLWFNTDDKILYVYDGSDYVAVKANPTEILANVKVKPETITDDQGNNHDVLSSYIGTQRYSILSKDTNFRPQPAITGFTNVYPGINLRDDDPNAKFVGTATNADHVNGLDASHFMRTDLNTGTTGNVWIRSNDGIFLGANRLAQFAYESNNNLTIKNTQANGSIFANVTSGGNTQYTAVEISGNDSVNLHTNMVVDKRITTLNLTVTGTSMLGGPDNVHITGGANGNFLATDGSGNLYWQGVGDTPFPSGDMGLLVQDFSTIGGPGNLEFNTLTGFDMSIMPRYGLRNVDLGPL